ncbi:MAG: ABC transporter permease [Rudaea sp.]
MRLHIVELIFFSAYAELRAERSRSYLGFVWWLLDPALQMGIYYLVFSVVLKSAQSDFVPFLLIGLTVWQWFKSCVSHGGHAIWQNLRVIRQVKLPAAVFPSVQILADTVKFLCILALLLVVLWSCGYRPNAAYAALPAVLIVELIFASAIAYFVAAIMPLLPDLRFVIEQILTMLMFVSGIVIPVHDVASPLRELLMLNPMVEIVEATRGILMRGEWPHWPELLGVTVVSIACYVASLVVISRLTHRYVKLPS